MVMCPTVLSRFLGVWQRYDALLPQEHLKEQAPFFAPRDVPESPLRTSPGVGRTPCREPPPPPSPIPSRGARSSWRVAAHDMFPMPAMRLVLRSRFRHESL